MTIDEQIEVLQGKKDLMAIHACASDILNLKEEIGRLQGLLKSTPPCQACLGNPMITSCEPWCKEAQRLRKSTP